jgi:hypothetical protein
MNTAGFAGATISVRERSAEFVAAVVSSVRGEAHHRRAARDRACDGLCRIKSRPPENMTASRPCRQSCEPPILPNCPYPSKDFRPSQDSFGTYGRAIHFRKIVELTPKSYSEEPLVTLNAPAGFSGLHTYNRAANFEVIDGKKKMLLASLVQQR